MRTTQEKRNEPENLHAEVLCNWQLSLTSFPKEQSLHLFHGESDFIESLLMFKPVQWIWLCKKYIRNIQENYTGAFN